MLADVTKMLVKSVESIKRGPVINSILNVDLSNYFLVTVQFIRFSPLFRSTLVFGLSKAT